MPDVNVDPIAPKTETWKEKLLALAKGAALAAGGVVIQYLTEHMTGLVGPEGAAVWAVALNVLRKLWF